MDANTMQLALVTPDRALNEVEETSRRWFARSTAPKKHRVQDRNRLLEDRNRALEADLARSQELNRELSETLSEHLKASQQTNELLTNLVEELGARVDELEEKLRLANEANEMNARSLSFSFPQRPVDGPEDQATMPVPQVELLAETSGVKVVAADAATALLERVVPKIQETQETQETQVLEPVRPVAAVRPLVVDEDEEPEVYNETSNGWQVRQPAVAYPITWGQPESRRDLRADRSTTGTFKVVSLQARSVTPTAVPGMSFRVV